MTSTISYRDRIILAAIGRRGLDSLALRALHKAVHLLGLALGERLREMRQSGDPLLRSAGELQEQGLLVRLYSEALEIQASRWDKLPERRRPHYSPAARFRILRVKVLLALSAEETARLFRVSAGTIQRWEQELRKAPEAESVGSLIKPVPPVRRYADVVRHLVQTMTLAGFPGTRSVAQVLARAGWRLSRRTVQRIRDEPRVPPPQTAGSGRTVTAREPNHVWMADITEVPGLFRLLSFKVAMIIDVFSRMPLAYRVFWKEPRADQFVDLVQSAVQAHGAPRHFVTDQGPQFTAGVFREALRRLGIRQRFGAIGRTGSIAIVERFFRTLKEMLRLRTRPPLLAADLRRRLDLGLRFYAFLRPHQGLGGAVPAEVYLQLVPANRAAVPPPRGQPGEPAGQAPFEIVYLDDERTLPYLIAA